VVVQQVTGRLGLGGTDLRRFGGSSWPVALLLLAGCIFLAIGSSVSSIFAQQTVAGLAQGGYFGSLALALVLIYRASGVFNFAQGEMAMFTTYVAFQLTEWGIAYWASFFLTLGCAFAFGVLVQLVFIRPVEHRSPITVVIVTIGLFILIDGVVQWIWGAESKFMPAPFSTKGHEVGGVSISYQDIGTIAVTVGSAVLLWVLFRFTKVGLGMRASALRPAAARLVGVRVSWMLALGWGLAAVLGAIAGLMTEANQFTLSPSMMQSILLYAFAAAVLGGVESPAGAVVGGLVLGVFLNLLGQYVGFVTSELRFPVALIVLLGVLLIRPAGLFGRAVVRKV
jgi:branched-chain amino acid transport system permease protein